MVSETRYARSGDVSIAYRVAGDGPFDIVLVPGSGSHVELAWDLPVPFRAWFEQFASFARLIHFDKRGTGMSDRRWDRCTQGRSGRVTGAARRGARLEHRQDLVAGRRFSSRIGLSALKGIPGEWRLFAVKRWTNRYP